MSLWNPYKYQTFAGKHIRATPKCGLFLEMGMGKTVITLTELDNMLNEDMSIDRILIIAPKRVVLSVWAQEAQKWDHLKHLTFSVVWGDQRTRLDALRKKADIYLINCENVVWLTTVFQSRWPFDCVVLDELSKFKSYKSQRFKAIQRMGPQIKRLIGLTGTPAPNGLMDLWAPIYLMDQGQRLEKNITGFRERYFVGESQPGTVHKVYRLRKEAKESIYNKIADLCISMQTKDYLDLPPVIQNDVYIDFDSGMQQKYDQFKEEAIMAIGNEEITALSAAALGNKLMQFANGAVYHTDNPRDFSTLHDCKLDALGDIIDEAQGNSVLVFYTYQHDAKRILAKYPHARALKTQKDIDDWNAGKIPLMIAHPASTGHGLNLQDGGHIMVWFGLNWSLELYMQAIARLLRLGQTHPLIIHRILVRKTMDIKVAKALEDKEFGQNDLMQAVRAEVEEVKLRRRVG